MSAAEGCVLMAFILYISGVQAKPESVCAFNGSLVELNCSAHNHNTTQKWYFVYLMGSDYTRDEIPANDKYVYNRISFSLTISTVTESDAKLYCCGEEAQTCYQNMIQLQVTDVQVQVVPAAQGQRVALLCSTSCPLTNYTWFRNTKYLYTYSSPWYQELVGSDAAVTYSCAPRGYRDDRAPDVSVDSITSSCITVTYARGRTCPDGRCSITYPTDVHVKRTTLPSGLVRLTCNSSCASSAPPAFIWYKNRVNDTDHKTQYPPSSTDTFSCAVKGHESLLSAEVCVTDKKCWTVNYSSRRVCAAVGSSVNISSEYSHPENQQPKFKGWCKKKTRTEECEMLKKAAGQEDSGTANTHILMLRKLRKSDSAEYVFRVHTEEPDGRWDLPGVSLTVTDLKVKFSPSPNVTEGDRVTLSCFTTCPLTNNTGYVWYMNGRVLTGRQHKLLVLDPVSSDDAGIYSCGFLNKTISNPKSLTVQSISGAVEPVAAAAAAAAAVALVLTVLTVSSWIRRKTTSGLSRGAEAQNNMQQLNSGPLYGNISAHPTRQDDHHYQGLVFSAGHTDNLYSTMNRSEGGQSC